MIFNTNLELHVSKKISLSIVEERAYSPAFEVLEKLIKHQIEVLLEDSKWLHLGKIQISCAEPQNIADNWAKDIQIELQTLDNFPSWYQGGELKAIPIGDNSDGDRGFELIEITTRNDSIPINSVICDFALTYHHCRWFVFLDRTKKQIEQLTDTILAMQSLDDLGSPAENDIADRTMLELQKKRDLLEAKLAFYPKAKFME